MEKNKFDDIKSFTGLQGVAILLILLYFIFPQKLPGGFLGIIIFYTITGFLVMRKIVEDESISVLEIFKQQIKRIYPQMLLMTFVICVLSILFFKTEYNNIKPGAITSLLSINNYYQVIASFRVPGFFEGLMPFRHMWAISLWLQTVILLSVSIKILIKKARPEMVTYLLFLGIVGSVVLMGVIYVITDTNRYVYYAIETRYFSFLLGAYVSYKMRANYREMWENYLKNIFTNYYILIILVVLFIVKESQGFQYVLGLFLFSFLTAAFLVRIYHSDTYVAKLLSTKPFLLLGKNAFVIYLWQYPILALTSHFFAKKNISYAVVVVLHLILTIICVWGSEWILKKSRLSSFTKGYKQIGQLLVVVLLCITVPTFTKAEPSAIKNESSSYHFNEAKDMTAELNTQINELSQQYEKVALNIQEYRAIRNKKILCVGDTVIIGAKDEVMDYFPRMIIDAKETRQFGTAAYIIDSFMKSNDCDIILIELGTNGVFSEKEFDQIMKSTKGKPVYFINTAMREYWEEPVNKNLQEWTSTKSNATLIDWFDVGKRKKELLAIEDRKHTTQLGSKVYAQLIAKVISQHQKE